jgi:hypothetical protein
MASSGYTSHTCTLLCFVCFSSVYVPKRIQKGDVKKTQRRLKILLKCDMMGTNCMVIALELLLCDSFWIYFCQVFNFNIMKVQHRRLSLLLLFLSPGPSVISLMRIVAKKATSTSRNLFILFLLCFSTSTQIEAGSIYWRDEDFEYKR